VSFSFRGAKVIRAFGLGLTMQALLSASNFAVGLILIRRTNDLQYSYYILATNALLLLTSLQTSFIQPYIVSSITKREQGGRADLVGALIRGNTRWVPLWCGSAVIIVLALWAFHIIGSDPAWLIVVSLVAGATALVREFFRVTLFAFRRPFEVLQGDLTYVVLLIGGVFLATLTAQPTVVAVGGLGFAALMASAVVRRGLWRFEPWNTNSPEGVFKGMAAQGAWAILGSGIHWLLIQGYSYLVAGVLDVRDIAAIAATRLTLVPVFVLSGGVSMLLFPITSRWVHDLGATAAARRLALLVGTLVCAALLYMLALWVARDWIFTVLMKKEFAQRDSLLLMWSAVFLVTLCRDQLATLPASRGRFRDMTLITCFSAGVWLIASYAAMTRFGPLGAVAGMLIGELVNVVGIIVMILKESRHETTQLADEGPPPIPSGPDL
jgi:O-antigen/teichoic acid export membrane protein